MNKKVKVSIILPSLNVKEYIGEAIESVIAQTLDDIEILCVDAGSDDGTLDIIKNYQNRDDRIRLIESTKKSYGHQLNIAINQAKGKYIAVVETDDFIDAHMCEELYVVSEKYDLDYVKADYFAYFTSTDGEKFFLKRKTFLTEELYGKVICPKEHTNIATDDWYLWQGIYNRDFLIRNRISLSETAGAAFQDIGFLYQVTRCAKRAMYLPQFYYNYCIDRMGSSSNAGKSLEYAYEEYSKIYELLVQEDDKSVLALYYARLAKSFLIGYSELGLKKIRMSDNEIHEIYLWFSKEIKNAISLGIISKNNMHSSLWDKLNQLILSPSHFLEDDIRKKSAIKEFLGDENERQIILFGCGNYGYAAYRWLTDSGYSVFAFMDNNHELWGRKINGIPILNPSKYDYSGTMKKYIVANEKHYEEIKEQLLKNNVPDERIIVFG